MDSDERNTRERYIFIVSDATGDTCQMVVKAALSQFKTTKVNLETVKHVLSRDQIEEVIQKAANVDGIVIFTFVSPESRHDITELGRQNGVPTVDILGPILTRFSDLLEISPLAQPGLFRQLDKEYFKRIEAVDFTIKHDDSMGLSTLKQAEIVLLGVSRTTKTPVSIYLSYRGWKVANIPIILDRNLPVEVSSINQKNIIGLTINPHRLHLIRLERQQRLKGSELKNYVDLDEIKREISFSNSIFRENGWPTVNVTYKSIEETATEVMRIIFAQQGVRKGSV